MQLNSYESGWYFKKTSMALESCVMYL
jgi:hypothetical protein